MKKYSILFSAPMVEAILDGRKTQTRRVLKKQPLDIIPIKVPNEWVTLMTRDPNRGMVIRCRYGVPGDHLWVRETFNAKTQSGKWYHEVKREDRPLLNWAWTNPVRPAYEATPPRWLPGIHMPREACRIELEIVNVRVERVQEIMPGEAVAEGIERITKDAYFGWRDYTGNNQRLSPLMSYQSLWDSINSPRGFGWDVNPWVWVIEFRFAT